MYFAAFMGVAFAFVVERIIQAGVSSDTLTILLLVSAATLLGRAGWMAWRRRRKRGWSKPPL
jgi:LPXTG-motif cell wall-anchored protein